MPSFNIPVNYRALYVKRLEEALNFIDQNLTSDLDLSKVAGAAHFSPYHFHRIFCALMDETPQDYINRLRVERAANLLVKTSSLSITEIAFASGFSSLSAFSRSFKKTFGVSPRQYLNRETALPAPVNRPSPLTSEPEPPIDMPDVKIVQSPPIHLAYFASRRGYDPQSVKTTWLKMFHWAEAHRLMTPETRLVAISYDDPEITPIKKCRYYACIPVPEEIKDDPSASFFDFPEHLCAVQRIECETDEYLAVYRRFYRYWMPGSGFVLTDYPPYEIYYDAPDVHPGSKYVFDLCIPVMAV